MKEAATTQDTGVVQEAPPPTNEAEAVDRIARTLGAENLNRQLEPVESNSEETIQEAEPTSQPEAEPVAEEVESQETADEADPSEGEEAESDPTEEVQDLEDFSVTDLAEALEMSEEDIAQKFRMPITVNGKTEYVTLHEAAQGHLREADYTRKTQGLAEERRSFNEQAQRHANELNARLQRADDYLAVVGAQLNAGPSDADLHAMLLPESDRYDPEGYIRVKADRDSKLAAYNQVHSQRNQEREQAAYADQQRMLQRRTEQQERLRERMPELSDPVKAADFESGSRKYLNGAGFTDEDVDAFFGGAFDHRQVEIVSDAMKYRAMKSKGKETVKTLKTIPKMLKPGASKSGAEDQRNKSTQLRDRLVSAGQSRSGTVRRNAATEWIKSKL